MGTSARGRIVPLFLALVGGLVTAEPLLVMPLQAAAVDAESRKSIGLVIETALVESGSYEVTSLEDVELLLEAQSLYMTGLFDESRLPAVGAFLPAGIAALSRLESRAQDFLLQIKIVEISSGRVLRAKTETIPDLSEPEARVRSAVFALLGIDGPRHEPAGSNELLIDSDIKQSEVYVDHRQRGETPCAVGGLASGEHLIELKKGAYFASKIVKVDSSARIYFILGMRYGSLIVNSEPRDPEVTVGGVFYNRQSLIENIPAERQSLSLRKPGWFWQGEVPVSPDQSTMVNIKLLPTAALSFGGDEKTRISIKGNGIDKRFGAPALIDDLLPGNYSLGFERPNREPSTLEISLAPGETKTVEPSLAPRKGLEAEQDGIRSEIDRLLDLRATVGLDPFFYDRPIPDPGTQATGDLFLSFIPLVNTTLLLSPDDLPPSLAEPVRYRRLAQFGLGNLTFFAGLSLFLVPRDSHPLDLGAAAMTVAALSAGANIAISLYDGIRLGRWLREEEARQDEYERFGVEIDRQRAMLASSME
ncbi:MAG: PEGA domain-containing protein [Spirochaetaceae bacterium]|nr:PEGA domain-containing protein [Spirochaetaceae bacterium]